MNFVMFEDAQFKFYRVSASIVGMYNEYQSNSGFKVPNIIYPPSFEFVPIGFCYHTFSRDSKYVNTI